MKMRDAIWTNGEDAIYENTLSGGLCVFSKDGLLGVLPERQGGKVVVSAFRQLDVAYDNVAARLKSIISRNHRLTKLLRATLPEEQQIGCGLEGMIASLLAMVIREHIGLELQGGNDEPKED